MTMRSFFFYMLGVIIGSLLIEAAFPDGFDFSFSGSASVNNNYK